jgi:NADPH:quinone reductase-like Zn-dependent oxidoreductase
VAIQASWQLKLASVLTSKQLTTSVGSVLPLAEARAAHEMLAGTRSHRRGKIVLEVV